MSEKAVKEALKALSWPSLESHLLATGLATPVFDDLLGHLRRSEALVLKHASPDRERARDVFVEGLVHHVRTAAGEGPEQELRRVLDTLALIEQGYREILGARDASEAAKLLSETRAVLALVNAALAYQDIDEATKARLARGEAIIQSFRIEIGGVSCCPDAVLTTIVEQCSSMLLIEAHLNDWFDASGRLILPDAPDEAEHNDQRATAAVMYLALSWSNWQRMERRWRYFGGTITRPPVPGWAPAGATAAVSYVGIGTTEALDFMANERLRNRLTQTFIEMNARTSVRAKAAGIDVSVPLPPGHFVSVEEAHGDVALSEILGYDIVSDQARPGGLRLLEWVRGYAALQCLARASASDEKTLLSTVSRSELTTILRRVGLSSTSAATFIDLATFSRSSSDLFDQPLVAGADGSLVVFGPAIISANLPRVTLAAIAGLGVQLNRKGKAFEQDVRAFFDSREMPAHTFKTKIGGEQYEFDAIVEWQKYVFLFECKNLSLSNHNPIQAYYFALEQRSAARQVQRQADALRANPNVLLDRTGIDLSGKTLVPCVLNSLPYSVSGGIDDVWVTDASALKRFFEERYIHVIQHHNLEEGQTLEHRTAMSSCWEGDVPTPADLLRQLERPFQVAFTEARFVKGDLRFALGGGTVVVTDAFGGREDSVEGAAEYFGIEARPVRTEMKRIAQAADKFRKNRSNGKRLRIEHDTRLADRAWRNRRGL